MIQVKKNLTEEQVKQFSETREFGALDYIKGGLKKGIQNLANKAVRGTFQGAILVLKSTFNLETGNVSISIVPKKGKKSKSLGEANDSLKDLAKEIRDKAAKSRPDKDGKYVREMPIRLVTSTAVAGLDEDIDDEISKFIDSSDFYNIGIVKPKGV